ncbi:MAG: citryl-CoA lyase, partial [Rhizobiaceae bacterium]|nr:citryl-CoA lyase [Hyphomicrobiales bacterium]NRB31961.1 citryl-CoA lyase [Rhizobiaceae bacterium]
ATTSMLDKWARERTRYAPGFGHRFHKPEDPRAPRLLALVDEAVARGACGGEFAAIGRSVQAVLNERAGKPVPMNIDGATRSVGVLAHAWEQMQQGGRIKGPTPPGYRWTYDGPPVSEK